LLLSTIIFEIICIGPRGEPTGALNKLRVWVQHSPKQEKGARIVMPSKIARLIDTSSAAEVDKMQYTCFFLHCLHLERSCHRFLLFPKIAVSHFLPWEMPLHLLVLLYVINALDWTWRVLVCLHPSTQAYLAPDLFMFGLLSVFSGISSRLPVQVFRTSSWRTWEVVPEQGPECEVSPGWGKLTMGEFESWEEETLLRSAHKKQVRCEGRELNTARYKNMDGVSVRTQCFKGFKTYVKD
jgi:hypothetical protein